jgi:hypothetical protein
VPQVFYPPRARGPLFKTERGLGLNLWGIAAQCRHLCRPHRAATINLDKPPVKGKHDADVADALLATVARHLAKADAVARKAVLEAVLRLAREPNAATIGAFAEEISAAPLNSGARRSVIGAVMNTLPRSLGRPVEPFKPERSNGSDQSSEASIGLNKHTHKGRSRNTGQARNSHTGTGHNHRSDAQPRWPRSRR